MAWQAVQTFLRSGTVVSLFGGLVTTGSYVYYKDFTRYRRMLDVYSSGNILEPLIENQYEIDYCPRAKVERSLKSIMDNSLSNEFYLVNGEVGSGKTRTLVEMVRTMMKESGSYGNGAPVYVLATQGMSFPDTLASAVHFYFDEHIRYELPVQS